MTATVDELATISVPRRSALLVAQLRETTVSGKDLGRQLAAEFGGHRALDALEDSRDRRPVVGEGFRAIGHRHAGLAAKVLVVSALVGVLKTAPPAYVIDE